MKSSLWGRKIDGDLFMDVSTTSFSPAQMILAWILILLLLGWFFIFTTLAIHDFLKRRVEWEDIPASTRPIPIIHKPTQAEHKNVVEMAGSALPHDHAYPEPPDEHRISGLR
jgi:hypothetical protein